MSTSVCQNANESGNGALAAVSLNWWRYWMQTNVKLLMLWWHSPQILSSLLVSLYPVDTVNMNSHVVIYQYLTGRRGGTCPPRTKSSSPRQGRSFPTPLTTKTVSKPMTEMMTATRTLWFSQTWQVRIVLLSHVLHTLEIVFKTTGYKTISLVRQIGNGFI